MASEIAFSYSAERDSLMHVWDINSGVELSSFKTSAFHIALKNDAILAVQKGSALVHYLTQTSKTPKAKWVLPEEMRVIVVSPCGNYIAGGGASGRLFIWESLSGRMVRFWDAHYSSISALIFSIDCQILIAGSFDSNISIFNIQEYYYFNAYLVF